MKYSINWLLNELQGGAQFQYLLFWGHTQKNRDVIDVSCFSQWYPSPFVVDGVHYATAEHWMMAKKAALFQDAGSEKRIVATPNPSIAKSLGREVKNFSPETWSAHSYAIVVEGNRHKFEQNPELKDFLLKSGDQILVEASPVDAIWGIGISADRREARNPLLWRGANQLGFALMEARDQLK